MKTFFAAILTFSAAALLAFVADKLNVTVTISYFLDFLIIAILVCLYEDWKADNK